jgi:predicted metal-dependent peptidase
VNAMQKMRAARTALVLDQPFFGALALRLMLREDPTCDTAWVNGVSIGFNPTFVLEQTQEQLMGLLAHEVMHVACGHPWRRDGRDPQKWNEAADRVINPVLRGANIRLPENVLYELDPSHLGKSAEWVYDRLPRDPEPQDDEQGQGQGDDDDQQQGAGAGGDDDSDSNSNSSGNGDDDQQGGEPGDGDGDGQEDGDEQQSGAPEFGEVRDAPVGTEEIEGNTESDWQQAVQQARAAAKARGQLPAELDRFAQEAAEARVDWRSVLHRFFQQTARADYTWMRPNARYIAQGLYLPALRSEEVGPVVIAIDTSASLDDVLIGQFQREVRAVLDEVQPSAAHVIYCDARVQGHDVFLRGEPFVLRPRGGGGTDFRPVFDMLDTLDEPPVCVVYLTDLEGRFPDREPEVPVLWATIRDHAVPFGEKVYVE